MTQTWPDRPAGKEKKNMSDRVEWEERIPDSVWRGYVDGRHTYRVLVVGEPGPDSYPVWVGRVGAKIGAGCTNVGRAMDLAEMNETMPMPDLIKHGLALSTT
jgi:hypothetical protein